MSKKSKTTRRLRRPVVPMTLTAFPQQRVLPVASLPDRPDPFEPVLGYHLEIPGARFEGGPSAPIYLCQMEWAWSPMHSRLHAYYLSRFRQLWILWVYWFDDNWETWEWGAVAYVPRRQASLREAAVHLLVDHFCMERDEEEMDQFHMINEEGELTLSDVRTIGLWVWGSHQAQGVVHESTE